MDETAVHQTRAGSILPDRAGAHQAVLRRTADKQQRTGPCAAKVVVAFSSPRGPVIGGCFWVAGNTAL
ncbi:MAG: hypothetical protein JWP65_3254 [Ramlibacter sp.]|jgi:hypothetical protein|nr:hypothetical protein [Ramlibacter sp.]